MSFQASPIPVACILWNKSFSKLINFGHGGQDRALIIKYGWEQVDILALLIVTVIRGLVCNR